MKNICKSICECLIIKGNYTKWFVTCKKKHRTLLKLIYNAKSFFFIQIEQTNVHPTDIHPIYWLYIKFKPMMWRYWMKLLTIWYLEDGIF